MSPLYRIERLSRRTGMAESRIGREALNDPALVAGLRAGRVLRAATAAKLDAWLDKREVRA